ncbi:iron ABC transporter substrate-binding protein [Ancylobacter sp. 6x-1]|uniref:Iron ABC transporter substrate-binding protein n=1 Tax=Ancylobacter crimeensis TaxID=2579147 RepID=A0ABT0DFR9_9HYPH|nr:iron ABC transporter substrate-binding protein [Ancylobacter crimeensis]MCK0198803.1 iron ABC transporter substrate-binding protein [Ancylobacter crimeensis]
MLRTSLALGGLAAGTLARPAILRAASAEELTLYNGQHRQVTDAVVAAFSKKTGIDILVRNGSSPQIANQLLEEGDLSPADVFYSEGSPPVAALAKRGMLAKLPDDTLKQVPSTYVATTGEWTGVTARARVVAYNRDLLKEEDLPSGLLGFADAKWADKVGYAPASDAFQEQIVALLQMKGREATLDWLKGMKKVGRIYNNNIGAMQAVERGEIPCALINNYYWFTVAQEVGAAKMRSALHYIRNRDPGALITVSAAAILKTGRNLEAAQHFVAFLVSAEGQQIIANAMAEYPLRAGITSPFPLEPFDKLDPPPVTPADLGDAAEAIPLAREAGLA